MPLRKVIHTNMVSMTNDEMPNDERMTKSEARKVVFRTPIEATHHTGHSSFGLLSSFSHSSLGICDYP